MKNSIFIIFFALVSNLSAQPFNINGKVVDQKNGSPLLGVNILLVELNIGTITDEDGIFYFDKIPGGIYTLKFSYIGHKTIFEEIAIDDNISSLLIEMVESAIDLDEVMVTGNPLGAGAKDIAASAIKISNLDLQILNNSFIGEVLNFQPGIALRSNGPATGRPIIRGFSDNRVLILENGLRMGDLSNASDDHGIGAEGSDAERIEILRGPSSLLYGSNAIGGVVNIINNKIPSTVYQQVIGSIFSEISSINNAALGQAEFGYGINNFALQSSYFKRKSEDYRTPDSKLLNSDSEAEGFHAGVSFLPKNFSSGLSYSKYKTKYGIPFFDSGEAESEGPILIDMEKDAFRFNGGLKNIKGAIESVSLKAGFQKYNHKEIARETGKTGTAFELSTFSSDLSIAHSPLSNTNEGLFGVWFQNQSYNVEGEEAFTPNADYSAFAFYVFEQFRFGNVNLQSGLRYENNSVVIPETVLSDSLLKGEENIFNSLSGSLGIVFQLSNSTSLFSNIASAFRAPSIEELSSYSVHEALGSFDIGNRNLKLEKNLGLDFGLRVKKDFHLVELNIFYNNINDFIYRKPTDLFYNESNNNKFNSQNGIPVFEYTQSNAEVYGFETKARYEFTRTLSLTFISDYVRGRLSDGRNLPQIPPLRFSLEPRYMDDYSWSGIIFKYAAKQNNVADNENITEDYFLLDFYAGLKFSTGSYIHIFNFKVENILDEKYRDHLSALKDFAFMPGRNFKLNYKFIF